MQNKTQITFFHNLINTQSLDMNKILNIKEIVLYKKKLFLECDFIIIMRTFNSAANYFGTIFVCENCNVNPECVL